MSNPSFQDDEAFSLADALLAKPLLWSRSVPAPSSTPVLGFVKFRGFHRAIDGYRSFVQLLKMGQWEDALILARSLYELNLNLSEISCSPDPEQAAKKFVRFGKLQRLQLYLKLLQDQLLDEQSQAQPSPKVITDLEQRIAAITSTLEAKFAEFRNPNGKWQKSWSGLGAEALAQRLAKHTGGQPGHSDYFVFRLASLFTHNTPGSLFLALPHDRETTDWNGFLAGLGSAGQSGFRKFLYGASLCLVDIVGMAGGSIVGYERQWFHEFAIPLLKQLAASAG